MIEENAFHRYQAAIDQWDRVLLRGSRQGLADAAEELRAMSEAGAPWADGVITLRHNSRLHHIGLSRRLTGTRVLVLVADLNVRVLTEDGELIRALTLDPSRDYQATGRP